MTDEAVRRGVTAILSTPFRGDESVDHDALAAQVRAAIGWGAGAVGLGFASEVHRMDAAELDEVVATVAQAAGGEVAVMGHAWGGSVQAILGRIEASARAGATVVMVPTPLLMPTDPRAAAAFFTVIADASPIPIVVQDAPGVTGVTVPVPVLAALLAHGNVVAVKVEAQPSAPKVAEVVALADGAAGVLGGGGGLDFWHELQRGASGTMPSSGFTDLFVTIQRLFEAGEREQSRRIFNRLVPFLSVCTRSFDTYAVAQKHVLSWRGIHGTSALRRPHEHADTALTDELRRMWADVSAVIRDHADRARTVDAIAAARAAAGRRRSTEGPS